jgi:hypothetical protein
VIIGNELEEASSILQREAVNTELVLSNARSLRTATAVNTRAVWRRRFRSGSIRNISSRPSLAEYRV